VPKPRMLDLLLPKKLDANKLSYYSKNLALHLVSNPATRSSKLKVQKSKIHDD
jgi:hypothetical protein